MAMYDFSQFDKDLEEWGIVLDSGQKRQFIMYYELLKEWNTFMNLTAITDYDQVLKKHFVDSLSLVKGLDILGDRDKIHTMNVIDVGTGAGFPGIPLKIVFPKMKITLLDSLNKRIKFLDQVVYKLDLDDVDTLHGRAEDFAKPGKLRERFEFCVSRAVANLSTLAEYALPFVKIGGYFIAYKSEKLEEEMEKAQKAISLLGGQIAGKTDFLLPDSDIVRSLLVVKKVKPTPVKYPRKAGLPTKEPLG